MDLWARRLAELGIEHSGILPSQHESGAQIWLRDPDNIWLEFYWLNRDFFVGKLRERWRAGRRTPATPA
ncbi:hypothetical protein AB0K12_47630 [Nonomuraea sp. NPDC049419]|uniref:hypothetical protein n=1 Tax=Nonomuraea sp. NPDC049419 TaxID=3155772 RepID=UPI00341EF7A8